jgi:hypothetical protein
MMIDDFNIIRLTALEPEADAPLVVDADTPLPGTVSGQRFQAVGRRHAKIVERHSRVQLGQSLDRTPQDIRRKAFGFSGNEKTFGFGIRDGGGASRRYFLYSGFSSMIITGVR